MIRKKYWLLAAILFLQIFTDGNVAEAKKRRRKKGPEKITDQYLYDLSFPRQSTLCKLGERNFEVMIRGKTYRPDEEETKSGSPYLFVKTDSKVVMATKETEENPGYQFLDVSKDSICDKAQAFSMVGPAGGAIVAILFKTKSGQAALLYDTYAKKVTELNRTLSGVDKVEKITGGFRFRPSLDANDGKSASTNILGQFEKNGVKFKYSFVDILKPWKQAFVQKGHLKIKEDFNYIFENPDWKKYFENTSKMQKALGYKHEVGVSKKFVYQADSEDGTEHCLLFQSVMEAPTDKAEWLCLKK